MSSNLPPINSCNLFYTYTDLDQAWHFYRDILGYETLMDRNLAKVMRVSKDSTITLADASLGINSPEENKCVTLAVVTPQVEAWYDYLTRSGVSMHREYNPKPGDAHDGFVALDPEGYFLEFERFNPHAENDEKLLPILSEIEPLIDQTGKRPAELAVQGTVVWLYYPELEAQQRFYEALFGVDLMVDQGWAKVYQISETGFVGLVDGARGLHQVTETKGVTVSFLVDNLQAWRQQADAQPAFSLKEDGPNSFAGLDLGGYLLRWDQVRDIEDLYSNIV
ncbi:MAG: VOC family protein [Chloroflexota bacterium]